MRCGRPAGLAAGSRLRSRRQWLEWADAVGLATFCVIGTDIAMRAGAPALSAVLMGIVTAAFGGLLRDLLASEVPLILRREIYATAAAAGSLTYIAIHAASGQTALALVFGFAVALAARSAAPCLRPLVAQPSQAAVTARARRAAGSAWSA